MTTERVLGDAIVGRLKSAKLDARANAAARVFVSAHKRYAGAHDASAKLEATRSQKLAGLGVIDARHDQAASRLADKLVGAGLAKRAQPFRGLSKLSPSELSSLAYARQVVESANLVKAVRKLPDAPRDVIAACDALDRETAALETALPAYDAAHKAWLTGMAVRDAELLAWQKALSRFRVLARASMIDALGAYEALFAPPESIAVPTKARKRRKNATPAAPVAPPAP